MIDDPLPVVGIDTNSKGFHLVSSKPIKCLRQEEWWEGRYGWWTSASKNAQDRRQLMYFALVAIFQQLPSGTAVFVEEPLVLSKNPDTTRKLVMVGGLLEAAFFQAKPQALLFWVDVSTWRRQVLNPPKGQAPRRTAEWKAWAEEWVRVHGWREADWSSQETITMEHAFKAEPDLFDAACISEYGRKIVLSGLVKVP